MINDYRPLPMFLVAVTAVLVSVDGGVDAYDSQSLSTVHVGTREELVRAVNNAEPGTEIRIAPGTYRGGLSFTGLRGTPEKPIVLTAADEQQPPEFKGGATCIQLSKARSVQLRHLVLSGASANGLNIDDGGDLDDPADHIVLHHLQVRDIGPRGNRDGIKLSGVDNFALEGCTIERWGDGGSAVDMVGCHKGRISDCTFRYRDEIFGNGVQTKGGSAEIIIQRCRFENAGSRAVQIGGSTGQAYFRPQSPGYEAKDITVEDCTIIGSQAAVAFVGVDGATVRYNTIYRPVHWVARILQESQGADFVNCRNGRFTNNLIAFRADELRTVINVGSGTAPETFTFAENHWYCIGNPQRSNRLNLPVRERGGRYGLNPQFADAANNDLRLLNTTPVRDAGVRPQSAD